jgi:hypothetical protein
MERQSINLLIAARQKGFLRMDTPNLTKDTRNLIDTILSSTESADERARMLLLVESIGGPLQEPRFAADVHADVLNILESDHNRAYANDLVELSCMTDDELNQALAAAA